MGRVILLLLSGVFCQQAQAVLNCGGPTIDVREKPYKDIQSVIEQSVGISDEQAVRASQLHAVAGAYREKYGWQTLGNGSSFKMIYKNGTRECAVVVNKLNSYGTVPIDGTQSDGMTFNVESSRWFIRQFSTSGFHGTYRICYDYYSNGEWTATQCTVKVW